jgi:hypothetical protein
LLPNGKVLVTGGDGDNGRVRSTCELYDPARGTWTQTGRNLFVGDGHTATLLSNGKVLVAGGYGSSGPQTAAELYDPASGTWTSTGSLAIGRGSHTATLLPNGKVLVAAGNGAVAFLATAELYDVGLDFDDAWQPEIAVARWSSKLVLTGSLFQGISQTSGGNTQDSSTNYPVVQLRSIDSSQIAVLSVDPRKGWSDTSFISQRVKTLPLGPALVTIFTNGIPSASTYLVVTQRQR